MNKQLIVSIFLVIGIHSVSAQKLYSELINGQDSIYNEHVLGGSPDSIELPVYIRQGYVMQYNNAYRIPNWVAYHVIPDYLNTPKREKKYKRFRTDPDIDNPVKKDNYTGSGYARGHMAPYFAMGGDRDKNGKYADLFDDNSDPYDDTIVLQANYMSNIAPQDQNALNGAGGPWYALETVIRKKLIKKEKMDLNIIVGTIIDNPNELKKLVNKRGETDIVIPERFYQVFIYKDDTKDYVTAGFLFPHVRERYQLPYQQLIDYLVPVDSIETITGLNFFKSLENEVKESEKSTNKVYWKELL